MPEVPQGRPHQWGSETITARSACRWFRSTRKEGGAVPIAPHPCSRLQLAAVDSPKKKSRCSVPGLLSLMTNFRSNSAHKYLCVRLIRPSRSRWYLKPCFNRVTTEELQPDNSGAAEPPSFGLAGGFVRRRKRAPAIVSKGSVSIRAATLASEKERREVGSAGPH